ncbi:serine/arginine-rich splicing factor 4-like [Pecten maximus]|uniref:serine/arginine-rich splicing factor 4-like n=1 Tax=Pecten maximus TaxID=6579 RepID=UPI0014583293|nr:serine/arginine-rich splicing factor 4-like [Pecten maximus]
MGDRISHCGFTGDLFSYRKLDNLDTESAICMHIDIGSHKQSNQRLKQRTRRSSSRNRSQQRRRSSSRSRSRQRRRSSSRSRSRQRRRSSSRSRSRRRRRSISRSLSQSRRRSFSRSRSRDRQRSFSGSLSRDRPMNFRRSRSRSRRRSFSRSMSRSRRRSFSRSMRRDRQRSFRRSTRRDRQRSFSRSPSQDMQRRYRGRSHDSKDRFRNDRNEEQEEKIEIDRRGTKDWTCHKSKPRYSEHVRTSRKNKDTMDSSKDKDERKKKVNEEHGSKSKKWIKHNEERKKWATTNEKVKSDKEKMTKKKTDEAKDLQETSVYDGNEKTGDTVDMTTSLKVWTAPSITGEGGTSSAPEIGEDSGIWKGIVRKISNHLNTKDVLQHISEGCYWELTPELCKTLGVFYIKITNLLKLQGLYSLGNQAASSGEKMIATYLAFFKIVQVIYQQKNGGKMKLNKEGFACLESTNWNLLSGDVMSVKLDTPQGQRTNNKELQDVHQWLLQNRREHERLCRQLELGHSLHTATWYLFCALNEKPVSTY